MQTLVRCLLALVGVLMRKRADYPEQGQRELPLYVAERAHHQSLLARPHCGQPIAHTRVYPRTARRYDP